MRTVSVIFSTFVPLVVAFDSKDLFTSLSTQRNFIDESIRADFNDISYDLERRSVVKFIRIPVKDNLAYPGTKQDSPVTEALPMKIFNGRFSLVFPTAESCHCDLPLC